LQADLQQNAEAAAEFVTAFDDTIGMAASFVCASDDCLNEVAS
jgi:hypothetical protein